MTDTGRGYIEPIRIFDRNDRPIDENNRFPVDAQLDVGDIEIGAVEIKDDTSNTRATVKGSSVDNALTVTETLTPTGGTCTWAGGLLTEISETIDFVTPSTKTTTFSYDTDGNLLSWSEAVI